MTKAPQKWLVVDCAALGWNLLRSKTLSHDGVDFPEQPSLGGLDFSPLRPPTPGVTCTAQAEFRTGSPAAQHGMVANGVYHRGIRKPMFWEQSAAQVEGPRIWEEFRASGGTVGMMFWQQSLGEEIDLVVSPRPIHKHGGGMVQATYTQPADLEDWLTAQVGRRFNLFRYWGPLACRKSTEWIVEATCALMSNPERCPDLLLTYLPHLDYDLQRHGPHHPKAEKALQAIDMFFSKLVTTAKASGRQVLAFGDYAITPVTGPAIFPNRALLEAGLMKVQRVKRACYPDLFSSPAFAVVDHQVAHVHLTQAEVLESVHGVLSSLDGVESVFRPSEVPELHHPNAGELMLFAEPGRWFAYPWWTDPAEAPDFATHVDIHNKPGFDPCELFFGTVPWQVSADTSRVGGTHGRGGPDALTAWASTDPDLLSGPDTPSLQELAQALRQQLG